ncbi:MAG: uncharacterized protein JWM68_3492 [Verrucomicrobiales bacterium]|nr:uncharacterized protein [Verrucomicrobiales bacterium]
MPEKIIYENCETCALRPGICHGVSEGFGLGGCAAFDHRLCQEWGWTCACNPKLLEERISEVKTFNPQLFRKLPYDSTHLPHYIPTVYHRYGRQFSLNLEYVAFPLHELFDITSEGFIPRATNAKELRHLLGVLETTKIIITGPGPDESIEYFWRDHQKFKLLELLAELKVEAFTIANYSFPLNCPPLHYRFNRARIFRLAERAAEAGVNPVLHLNASHENDWKDLEELLRQHPEITAVCLEFQTGYTEQSRAFGAIARLVELQKNIGRNLHPIIIGGSRHAVEFGKHFEKCTLIDAQPFLQTYYRKLCRIDAEGRITWHFKRTPKGEFLDYRFYGNIITYSNRLKQRLNGIEPVVQINWKSQSAARKRSKATRRQKLMRTAPLFSQSIQQDSSITSNESRIPQRYTPRFPYRKRGNTISRHTDIGSQPPQLIS